MLGLNEYIPTKVHTQKGVLDVKEISPGDIVYEYETNERLKVIGTVESPIDDIIQAEYTDGRSIIYSKSEKIFNGDNIIDISTLQESKDFKAIDPFTVDYAFGRIIEPLFPDPYIAGALLVYGRYDTEFINLPLDRTAADQLFSAKYALNHAEKLEDNTVFYAWNSSDPGDAITWKEFFPNYDFYATSMQITSPMIPVEYTRASVMDRMKFIMGVFDIGYDKDMFPNNVGIAHDKEERLIEVQKILWSLGVLSRITFDPLLPVARGRQYRLDVIGDKERYPGFFYDIDSIRDQILNNSFVNPINPFHLAIKDIHVPNVNGAEIEKGRIANLVLEKHNALYMTENFIPKVSL